MVRQEVAELLTLGAMPDSQANESTIGAFERAVEKIAPLLTNDEAVALTACFGPDDCFGLAWTLVHLIESAPGAVVPNDPGLQASEWIRLLWERAK
jgi:hypothetical protein